MSVLDPSPTTSGTHPIAGTVEQADPLMVSLDRRGDELIGPCLYEPRRLVITTASGHTHVADAGTPPKGTRCLVLFAEGDESQPWVVAFDSWPEGA